MARARRNGRSSFAPGPVAGDRLEHAVHGHRAPLEARVLRMYVEDRLAQGVHARDWIHPLREQVRRVEVRSDRVARDIAQPPERCGVVDDEPGMRLDRHPDPVRAAERGRLDPVGSTRASHCQASVSGSRSGQEQVTQLGRMECSDSPGTRRR